MHIAPGDSDEEFHFLYQARDQDSPSIYWVVVDNLFDPVRSDLRFIALLEELSLHVIECQ